MTVTRSVAALAAVLMAVGQDLEPCECDSYAAGISSGGDFLCKVYNSQTQRHECHPVYEDGECAEEEASLCVPPPQCECGSFANGASTDDELLCSTLNQECRPPQAESEGLVTCAGNMGACLGHAEPEEVDLAPCGCELYAEGVSAADDFLCSVYDAGRQKYVCQPLGAGGECSGGAARCIPPAECECGIFARPNAWLDDDLLCSKWNVQKEKNECRAPDSWGSGLLACSGDVMPCLGPMTPRLPEALPACLDLPLRNGAEEWDEFLCSSGPDHLEPVGGGTCEACLNCDLSGCSERFGAEVSPAVQALCRDTGTWECCMQETECEAACGDGAMAPAECFDCLHDASKRKACCEKVGIRDDRCHNHMPTCDISSCGVDALCQLKERMRCCVSEAWECQACETVACQIDCWGRKREECCSTITGEPGNCEDVDLGDGLLGEFYYIPEEELVDVDKDGKVTGNREGVVDFLSDYTTRIADLTRVDRNVDYDSTRDAWMGLDTSNYFAARWTGYLNIEMPGEYEFDTWSDDGSRLSIKVDGAWKEVVDNGGLHGPRYAKDRRGDRVTPVTLSEGPHELNLEFFENTGRAACKLYYKGPDTMGQEVVVPPKVLSRRQVPLSPPAESP